MAQSKIRNLICSCCGGLTRGRQWHNRDGRYGVCEDCIERIGEKETPEQLYRNYGRLGVHYCLSEWSVWVGGVEVNDFKLTKPVAKRVMERYKQDGYDDVVMERAK